MTTETTTPPVVDPNQFLTGVQDGWHAVPVDAIKYAATTADGISKIARAECGALVGVAPKFGAYDRSPYPVRYNPCQVCAWTVAAMTGQLEAEVQRLMPSNEDRDVLARLIPDPLIAVTAAAMIVEAVSMGRYGAEDSRDPAHTQLLAAISSHAPVILLPEDCAEDSCEHYPPGYDPLGGKGFECPRPEASVACAACSLQAGSWAGEWEGTFRSECRILAPCAPLTQLAEHAREALAEAKREAQDAADWEREQRQEAELRQQCCPMDTFPLSCTCGDNCGCMCVDCTCGRADDGDD